MTTDTFTNTDGTQIDAHDANWTATSGSQALSNATIQSNALQVDAWRNVYVYYDGSQEDSSELTLIANGTTSQRYVGPAVRVSGTQTGYSAQFNAATATDYTAVQIAKDGVFYGSIAGTWSLSTNHTIRIEATTNGSDVDIEAFVDDISGHTSTDTTTPLTGGFDGMYLSNGSTGTAVSVDDWTNGAAAGETIIPQAAHHSNIILG